MKRKKEIKESDLKAVRRAYFAIRFQIGLQGGGKSSELKRLRKEIARFLTEERIANKPQDAVA